jgi:hypothetical protein
MSTKNEQFGQGVFGVVPTPEGLSEGLLPLTGQDLEDHLKAMALLDETREAFLAVDVEDLYETLSDLDAGDDAIGVDTLEPGNEVVA